MGEGGGLQAPALQVVVGSGAVVVVERDLAPGQVADTVEQAGVIGFDLRDVMGAAVAEVGAVGVLGVLGVQGVGGDDRAGQVDDVQQGLEGGDLVALVRDLPLGEDMTGVVHRGEKRDVRGVAVREPRRALPSTAIARSPAGAGVVRAVRKAPTARSRASPSSWTRRRRKVWGCGTDAMPVSGSRGKPSARQAHAGSP